MSPWTPGLANLPAPRLSVTDSNGDLVRRIFSLTALSVMVALLVTYWSVTPYCRPRPLVDLPQVDHAISGESPVTSAVHVALRPNGQLLIGRMYVSSRELRVALGEIRRLHELSVALSADRRCSYSQVREIIQLIRQAGVERIDLEVAREEAPLTWPLGSPPAESASGSM